LACPVDDCKDKLTLLLKQLKSRTKKSGDPLHGFLCEKQDREGEVCFHRIDVERASQGLVQVLHAFPPEESPDLLTCCEVGQKDGYILWMRWHTGKITSSWTVDRRENAPSTLSWEQWVVDGSLVDQQEWKTQWHLAAEVLGIESLLTEKDVDGFILPEVLGDNVRRSSLGSTGTSQITGDTRGFRVIVASYRPSQVKVSLLEIDPAAAEALRSAGIAATTKALGPPAQQIVNVMYSGREATLSKRLNAAMPYCHEVSYLLSDSERDKFYCNMFKPLTLSGGTVRAFPAIKLERDDLAQTQTLLVANVVRSNDECWLEFQADEAFEFLPWIEETLGCKLDRWNGSPAGRWGW
jgi:hypothetical protein